MSFFNNVKNKVAEDELRDIKLTLDEIRADIRKMMVAPGRWTEESRASNEKVLNILINQLKEDADSGLEKGMVRKCGKREACKSVFTDLLQRSTDLVRMDKVSEEQVRKYRSELERKRAEASRSQCVKCFGEVSDLLDKNIRIVRSMDLYHTDEEIWNEVRRIQEDRVIKEVLEPIASKQRLKILKMLSEQSRSFTYLSAHSGLRGGNLLFHLQRLIDAGMIVQHYERGDYLLTEKGYTVLKGVVEMLIVLNEVQEDDGSSDTTARSKEGTPLKGGGSSSPA